MSSLSTLALLATASAWAAPAADTWRYAGPSGEAELELAAIVERVKAAPDAAHYVWQTGWANWKSWKDVPEIVAAYGAASAPPPAPTATPVTLSYSDGGPVQQLGADEIAAKVQANPSGRHLVWKPGMADWTAAREVPEVVAAIAKAAAPPPTPPSAPPAAPPSAPPVATPASPPSAPAPAAETPVARPAAAPVGSPAVLLRPWAEVHGEVWASAGVGGLGVPDGKPQPAIAVTRARPEVHAGLSDDATARVSVDVLPAGDGSLQVVAQEAWTRVGFGDGALRASLTGGLMETAFGVRDHLERHDAYFVGAPNADEDLVTRYGVRPDNDAGAAFQADVAEGKLVVDVQVLAGEGRGYTTGPGADGVARVTARPIPQLGIWASALHGGEGDADATRTTLFSAAVEGKVSVLRAMGEVVYGASTNAKATLPTFGYLVTGAADIPMKGEVTDHLAVVARYSSFDPIFGNAVPDGSYHLDAAANLYWKTVGDGTVAMTGVNYTTYIPQNLEAAVTHRITLGFAGAF